jgi:cyclic AMP-responsive element-binding protein 3
LYEPKQVQQHPQIMNVKTQPTTTIAISQHNNKINGKKVAAIQFKNGSKTRTVSTTNGDAMVMSKEAETANGVGNLNAQILLRHQRFQDIKDLRTIKIVNASSLNKKSPNIKLAAANMLQQSKQGLMPKNMIVTKAD